MFVIAFASPVASPGASAPSMPPAAPASIASPAPSGSPSPSASPTPAASATPSVIGPALIPNDPCTVLSALVSRPTVANSVCTVRPHHAMLETGIDFTQYGAVGIAPQGPPTSLRIGTDYPGLELDLQLPSPSHASVSGKSIGGVSDSGLGLKYVLGATPALSYGVQALVTIPTGTNGFSAGGIVQTYALNGTLQLGPVFALQTTQAIAVESDGSRSWGSYQPALVLAATLPKTTLSLFAEAAQFTNQNGPSSPTRTQLQFGTSFDPTPRLQLDLETGYSPNASTVRYHFIGAGLAYYL